MWFIWVYGRCISRTVSQLGCIVAPMAGPSRRYGAVQILQLPSQPSGRLLVFSTVTVPFSSDWRYFKKGTTLRASVLRSARNVNGQSHSMCGDGIRAEYLVINQTFNQNEAFLRLEQSSDLSSLHRVRSTPQPQSWSAKTRLSTRVSLSETRRGRGDADLLASDAFWNAMRLSGDVGQKRGPEIRHLTILRNARSDRSEKVHWRSELYASEPMIIFSCSRWCCHRWAVVAQLSR